MHIHIYTHSHVCVFLAHDRYTYIIHFQAAAQRGMKVANAQPATSPCHMPRTPCPIILRSSYCCCCYCLIIGCAIAWKIIECFQKCSASWDILFKMLINWQHATLPHATCHMRGIYIMYLCIYGYYV